MNKDKIAALVDSCADVPRELIERYGIYVVHTCISYGDKTYLDGVDITAKEVIDGMAKGVIPRTSLPSGDEIINVFNQIEADGYKKVLVVTISSEFSGTYNIIRVIGEDFENLDVYMLDTKNASLGSGMSAILAAENIEKGYSWEEVIDSVMFSVKNTKIFFCVSTLENLRRGGRIGLIQAIIGESFDIKPIISCNKDGVLYNDAKVMGRNKSLQKAIELLGNYINSSPDKKYNLAMAHGNVPEEASEVKKLLTSTFSDYQNFYESEVSTTLCVHTGAGVIGVGVQLLEE